MSIHHGHRKRLKERFAREGLESFHEINMLELLLFYCIPQKDTNPLAHALLDRFGNLCGVLEAGSEQLMTVEGVGESTATYLSMLSQLIRYYDRRHEESQVIVTTVDGYYQVLRSRFAGLCVEKVCMLCLDAKHRVISSMELTTGDMASAELPIRTVVQKALLANAAYVVLAHNHPNNVAIPSDEDVSATLLLADALATVGITLEDHLVVSDSGCVSLRSSRYFFPEKG